MISLMKSVRTKDIVHLAVKSLFKSCLYLCNTAPYKCKYIALVPYIVILWSSHTPRLEAVSTYIPTNNIVCSTDHIMFFV